MLPPGSNQQKDMFGAVHRKLREISGRLFISTSALWLLAALWLVEWLWALLAGITLKNMGSGVAIVVITLLVGVFLDFLPRGKRSAQFVYFLAFWLGLMKVGVLFSYLCATFNLPLLDPLFERMDSALGFNWLQWHGFVQAHAVFKGVLVVAYGSMFVQLFAAIIFFSLSTARRRAEEFWWSTMIAVIITPFVSGLLPALGTFAYYRTDLDLAVHLADLLALRDGTMSIFPLFALKGIITFPSFHAASAILLSYPYRHYKPFFSLVCVMNGLMLVSIPTEGGHYLVDVIAGVLVAVLSILIFRKMRQFKFAGRTAQMNGMQAT